MKAVTNAGIHMVVAAGNTNADACDGSPSSAGIISAIVSNILVLMVLYSRHNG